ncbi:urea transporter [Paraburkholderia megapolitana]|uniref:urea transporter n=1 Tax=Paraburkholderia megapolitana TaxID=420953 RepID=UPI0038BD21A9
MHAAHDPQAAALRTLLRSVGQIVLQPNAWTGACLLAALLICEPRLACAAAMGAVTANVVALLVGGDDAATRAGLHGFNGALAALAAFSFIADPAEAVAIAILAATATAALGEPWSHWLRTRGLSCYSSPCLIVTWSWLPFHHIVATPTAAATATHAITTFATLAPVDAARGVFGGLAQIAFASGALPGLLMFAGIAAASRRTALVALSGAALASGAQLLCGAPLSSFDAGLLGCNGALTALALVDSGVATMLGALAIAVLLQQLAIRWGWPAMTAPFVLATWSMQWLRRHTFDTLRRVPALDPQSHEEPQVAQTRATG